jgi:hypothetical protein
VGAATRPGIARGLPKRNYDQMPVTRVAFFRNENDTPGVGEGLRREGR